MKKKLLSVLAAAALGCSLFSAVPFISQAKEYTSGDYTYSTEKQEYCYGYYTLDDGCAITGYNGADKDIVIPSTLDGHTVKVISKTAFHGNADITSVVVPDTVECLDPGAFENCVGLTTALGNGIGSPDGRGNLWIPEFLFENCSSLENIKLPDGIVEIGAGAFSYCSSLKEIRLPDSVHSISYQAFQGCTSLKDFYDYNDKTSYYGASEVFKGNTILTIHGYPGSNAEAYAKEHNIAFAALTKEEIAERGKEMYRLYNPNSGEHFYTSDSTEKDNLVTAGWSDEGIGWVAPEKSNTPVYRLYNANAGDHHYTMDAKERDGLITAGWNDEGTGWYSDDDKTVPLYREYNPNAVTGTHNYTTDKAEHMNLVKAGWKDEGIGWYGIPEKQIDPLFPDAKIGDIVVFGAYEQDNDLTNGAEPIEWQYVSDRDGHKLLLSKYALDCRAYHDIDEGITWENCTLRKWLNNDFYNNAFSSSDKEKIVVAYNENPDSSELYKSYDEWILDMGWSGGQGGNATADNVFLLSWTEARDYFNGQLDNDSHWGQFGNPDYESGGDLNQALLCTPTDYAKEKGVLIWERGEAIDGCCRWWLRSPGIQNKHATNVECDGELDSWPAMGHARHDGSPAVYDEGIRPAILID